MFNDIGIFNGALLSIYHSIIKKEFIVEKYAVILHCKCVCFLWGMLVYMNKKVIIFSCITAILFGIYFIDLALKDDVKEIKKALYLLNPPMTNLANIEFLDSNQAIAFFESGNQERPHWKCSL